MADNSPKDVDAIGDPIISHIGDFGRYQFWLSALIFLSMFGTGWHTIAHVFLAAPTDVYCATINVTDPCSSECHDKEFDTSTFSKTIISEWDLTCRQFYLASLSQSIVMAGVMFGSILFGMMADACGRRIAILSSCYMQLICGLIVCVSPYFVFYCIFRFLTGLATGGTMYSGYVLMMEIIGPKRRPIVIMLSEVPFHVAHASLSVFSYYIRNWRWFQFSITIFSCVFILYYWLIPESPRWLLTTGNVSESIRILEEIARCNKLPTDHIRSDILANRKALSEMGPPTTGTVCDLFRTPYLRLKTLCLIHIWIAVCTIYYGVAQYIGRMEGNIFLNNLFSAGVAVPGGLISIAMTMYLGRKLTMLVSYGISAAGLLAWVVNYLANGPVLYSVICACIGLFGSSITFPAAHLWSGELFPTIVRMNGLGLCSMMARVGTITAPFICELDKVKKWIAPLIFGTLALLGIFICVWLPETRGKPLPETLEDAENFGRESTE